MKLYLMQHGEAAPKEVDPERRLNDRGRADVEGIARSLARSGCRPGRIAHSGKARAAETAEIVRRVVAPDVTPEAVEGMAPMDRTAQVAAQAAEWRRDTLLAGHQPFMGKLVSRLLCGDEDAIAVAYRPSTVVCLERDAEGRWSLVAMLRPDLS